MPEQSTAELIAAFECWLEEFSETGDDVRDRVLALRDVVRAIAVVHGVPVEEPPVNVVEVTDG